MVQTWLVSQTKVAVAEALGHFGNPKEEECLPLEAFFRRLLMNVIEDTSERMCVCVTVISEVRIVTICVF
jgi:hypothetical protein